MNVTFSSIPDPDIQGRAGGWIVKLDNEAVGRILKNPFDTPDGRGYSLYLNGHVWRHNRPIKAIEYDLTIHRKSLTFKDVKTAKAFIASTLERIQWHSQTSA